MISQKFAELLTIIKSAGDAGISSAGIFKVSTENKNSLITDPEMLSKLVFSVRNVALISTSMAAQLKFHNITYLGIDALDEYNETERGPTEIEKLIAIEEAENEAIGELYTEEDRYNDAVGF